MRRYTAVALMLCVLAGVMTVASAAAVSYTHLTLPTSDLV